MEGVSFGKKRKIQKIQKTTIPMNSQITTNKNGSYSQCSRTLLMNVAIESA